MKNWLSQFEINLERVTQFSFLGLILSSNLKCQCHTDYVARKLSRYIGVINTLKILFCKIYWSQYIIIFSHLNYCLVWGFEYKLYKKLYYIQNICVHGMTFNKLRAHTEPLFKYLNILKHPGLYVVKILKLCLNFFNNNFYFQLNHLLLRLIDVNIHYRFRNKTSTYWAWLSGIKLLNFHLLSMNLLSQTLVIILSGLLTIHQCNN